MDAEELLRSARLARGISLDRVMTETRMSPRVVHALDEGRFGDLPGGIYARSYVRMFAGVVGLDDEAVQRIAPLLPPAADPLPVIKEFVIEQQMRKARARRRALRTGAAAIVDAMTLLALGGMALECTARVAGTSGQALASTSAIPLALVFVALVSIYFLLLAGISGATIGTRVCGIELLAPERRLNLASIGTRAARLCLIEASLLTTFGQGLGMPGSAVRTSIGRLTFNYAKVNRRFRFDSPIGQPPIAIHSTIDD